MAARVKYLFDQDFAAGSAAAEKPGAPTEHALRLAEAETRGYRNGFDAAERELAAIAQRRSADAFERIGLALEQLARNHAAAESRMEAGAADLALAIARKLAPALVAREPFAEIAALARDCFRQLTTAPHAVVRVNDALLATARAKLEEIARATGFEGRVVVMAEPDIAPGDCTIEWADGGVIRDRAAIDRAAEEAVNRYVSAHGANAAPKNGDRG